MITENKYPEYKDSEIEWLGKIPSHWNTKRVKDLFEISRGRVISKEIVLDEGKYPVYSSQTKNNGILGYIDSYDFKGNYLTWTTDGANAGTVFIRKGDFNCTNVCGLLKIKKEQEKYFDLRFLYHIIKVIAKENKRDDINGGKLMSNEMGNLKIFYPASIEEQKAIAYFLDDKVGDITALIHTIDTQIENFEDYKKAMVRDYITNKRKIGNASNKGKSNLLRIKDIVEVNSGKSLPKSFEKKDGFPVYGANGVISYSKFFNINQEKVLLGRVGSCGEVNIAPSHSWISDNALILNIRKNKVINKFLYYFFTVFPFDTIISKTAHPLLTGGVVKNLFLNIPQIKEQGAIVNYLDEKIDKIDKLIKNLQKQKQNLIDYKKVLISDVVTGKIKVYNENPN